MGAPRSGTTLLASSIASHDKIIALPEMHYIFPLLKNYHKEKISDNKVDEIVEQLINNFHFCSLELFHTKKEVVSFIQGKNPKEIILGIVSKYNEREWNKKYTHWVEHSPHSYAYLETIMEVFPNARFIYIIRDPRAVYASTIKEDWGLKNVIEGAENWKKINTNILNKIEKYNIFALRYEDFLENQEEALIQISKYAGVEYNSSMLENKGLKLHEYFEKKLNMFGTHIDSSRIDKWKYRLNKSEISHINYISEDLLLKFNYDYDRNMIKKIRGPKRWAIMKIGQYRKKKYRKKFLNTMRNKFCHIH